jgi:hypothetical protein
MDKYERIAIWCSVAVAIMVGLFAFFSQELTVHVICNYGGEKGRTDSLGQMSRLEFYMGSKTLESPMMYTNQSLKAAGYGLEATFEDGCSVHDV